MNEKKNGKEILNRRFCCFILFSNSFFCSFQFETIKKHWKEQETKEKESKKKQWLWRGFNLSKRPQGENSSMFCVCCCCCYFLSLFLLATHTHTLIRWCVGLRLKFNMTTIHRLLFFSIIMSENIAVLTFEVETICQISLAWQMNWTTEICTHQHIHTSVVFISLFKPK